MSNLPPRLFLKFFRWYCHPKLVDHIEGDLIEVYRQRSIKRSKKIADIRFIIDVILLLRPGIIRPKQETKRLNNFEMFKNYLKVTLRVFNKERIYSVINLSGLAVGFTCCLMIYLFINDELSYDQFHNDKEQIYRVSSAYMRQGKWEPYASNAWRTSELLQNNYTQIESLVRIMNDYDMFEYGEKRIEERRTAWVDSNFFDMFNFPLVSGNPAEALKGTNKVVISEATAEKWFGQDDPIGKVFQVRDRAFELQVTGVMKDMPSNTHFHFDFLISNETLRQVSDSSMFTNVGWDSQHIYVKLAPGTDAAAMEASFPEFADKNMQFFNSKNFMLFLQPLTSIHLESNIGLEFEDNGSMWRVYTFGVIAIFILVIACVNYMNLTTARSMRRSKEVGMRKVLGAKRNDLVKQFLSESFVMTGLAVMISILITFIFLPQFNQFAGKQIPRSVLFAPEILTSLAISIIVIGFISGSYPALVLSSFRPLNSMKMNSGQRGLTMRKGLVILQFAVSIGLIAGSAIVFQQWDYMRNKSLGINKEAVISIPLQTLEPRNIAAFTNELKANPSVKSVGYCNMAMPGWISNSTEYRAQDVEVDAEVNKSMKVIRIDHDFFTAIEAQIIDGRDFSSETSADTISSLIINQSAADQLKWTDPVGKWMEVGRQRFTVVGVVKDFHFESVHRKIPPTVFIYRPRRFAYAYVRVSPDNVQSTIAHLGKTWSKFVTNRDFAYTFLSEDIEHQYAGEKKFTEVFTAFTLIAIAIACLGTFGLISFTAEKKSKEIGIRKVLGASVRSVSYLLIKEFIVLLLVASIIAWPITWYLLKGWIDGFVYNTPINAIPFIVATIVAAFIVVSTTGIRAVKAALANPVNSLRSE